LMAWFSEESFFWTPAKKAVGCGPQGKQTFITTLASALQVQAIL
jgi:hypothetical protein